jgi:hypothetical protein
MDIGTGGITINTGTTLDATGTQTIFVEGNWTNNGTFTPGANTVTFDKAAGTQTLASGNASFNNILHSGAGTLQLATNNLSINGTLSNTSGTFDTNDLAVAVDGNATISDGTYLAKSATQTFNSNLTVSGGTFTGATGAVYVEGNLTVSSGMFTAPSTTLYLEGDLDSRGGTFMHNNGTVKIGFDKVVSSLYGTSFYNLTCDLTGLANIQKELDFEAGSTKNIAGTLTLRGASATNLLLLRSTTPAQQWTVDIENYVPVDPVTGRRFIEYVDVKDSYNASGVYIFLVISHAARTWYGNSVDSGNNTNWFEPIQVIEGNVIPDIQPPEPPKVEAKQPQIALGDDIVNKKYLKSYAAGKYRTVVIVFEGRVVFSPYDEEGIKEKETVALTAGQQTSQTGEVK